MGNTTRRGLVCVYREGVQIRPCGRMMRLQIYLQPFNFDWGEPGQKHPFSTRKIPMVEQ